MKRILVGHRNNNDLATDRVFSKINVMKTKALFLCKDLIFIYTKQIFKYGDILSHINHIINAH